MNSDLMINALQLAGFVIAPALLAISIGAIIAGILRLSTQIDDPVIGFAGKIAGISLFLYLASAHFTRELLSFTARVWGGSDFYQ